MTIAIARVIGLALLLATPVGTADRQTAKREPCGCPSEAAAPRLVRLRIYNQSRMTAADIDALLDVANRLWLPYGITMHAGGEGGEGDGAVAVVMSNRRSRWRDGHGPAELGNTLFADGHATPYITLSLDAAEATADLSDEGGAPFAEQPKSVRTVTLRRMLGVALAHEMGHYLLDSGAHSSAGLLRKELTVRELVRQFEPWRLQLTARQQRILCARLAAAATAPDTAWPWLL